MERYARLLCLSLLLLGAVPARAFFHVAVIDELMAGVSGDPSIQYVEIRMTAPGQNLVTHSVLTSFSCDGATVTPLLVLGSNLAFGALGGRWIMATASPVGGIVPDFTFPASPGLPAGCGQVCWGAPGSLPPVDPDSWDHANPDNYVDCFAYGGYTGPTRTTGGIVTPLGPGDGTHSLTRSGPGVALVCPSPQNLGADVGGFGPCSPIVVGEPVSGKKLTLKDSTTPAARKLIVQSNDPGIDLGNGNGSADDPTMSGGSLRVSSSAGGAFDDTYALPAGNWQLIGTSGQNKGYLYKDKTLAAGPIKTAVVKNGLLVKLSGKGAALGHTLGSNPDPVRVLFAIGSKGLCMSFGGTVKFSAGKSYSAANAAAPASCP